MRTTGNDHGDDHQAPHTDATSTYHALLRSTREQWKDLEAAGDPTVQPDPEVIRTIRKVVRAEMRHGRQVEVPPTARGPFTVSELSLRALIRDAVDSVDGARALRAEMNLAPAAGDNLRTAGRPTSITCRITASQNSQDLPQMADLVRRRVHDTLRHHFQLPVDRIDVHIEDLHDG